MRGHTNKSKTLLLCKNKSCVWWKLKISVKRAVAKVEFLGFYRQGFFCKYRCAQTFFEHITEGATFAVHLEYKNQLLPWA